MQKRSRLDLARADRAAREPMIVRPNAGRPGCYHVESRRGTYLVDTTRSTCTCPDFRNRIARMRREGNSDAQCKHLLRVNNGTKWLQAQMIYGKPKRTEWKEAV